MNASKLRATATAALILLLAAGCDNVSWGGTEVTVVPPPERTAPAARANAPVAPVARGPVELPDGPILYRVTNDGDRGQLTPIAEIGRDSLHALQPGANPRGFADGFIAEHMREGAEFVLFHDGGRVGTFIIESASFDGGTACRPLPSARGILELGPAGRTVPEFLAMERLQVPQDVGRARRPDVTRSMQVLGPILAEQMMRQRRASLPGDWQRAFAQLTPFPLGNGAAFAATFLVGDTLGPGLDDQGYSIFYIAEPRDAGYDTTYVSYRPYPQGGKQAPRLVEFLDWDRDGQAELLLRVYGTADSWVEALDRSPRGGWRRTFEDRCTVPASADSSAAPPPPPPGVTVVAPDTLPT